jgi:hypothetical protein
MIAQTQASQSNHHQKGNHLEVEAVMGSRLNTLSRYRSGLMRDLYRAIETLRNVQAERRRSEKEEEAEAKE